MKRWAIAASAIAFLLTGCSDPGIAPGDQPEAAPRYGAAAPGAIHDLGLRPPVARAHAPGNGALVDVVINGSFETNEGPGSTSLDGWGAYDVGSGAFFAQTGAVSPWNGFPVEEPTDGAFAAMTDQTGPGFNLVYQDVVVPRNAELGFDLYLLNQADDYYPGDELWSPAPNQHFRMDVLDPYWPSDFVGEPGVLANVYLTRPGDPLESGYRHITYDMSDFAGDEVRLRFAAVNTEFYFNVGIDNVTLVGRPLVGKGVVHSVTGSGHLTTPGSQRIFAFSAVERHDGSVSGEFTLKIQDPTLGSLNSHVTRVHAEVICLNIQGDRAWVGGVVRNSTNPDWVGGEMGWAVQDLGEGHPSPDLISLINTPQMTPGLAQHNCESELMAPEFPIEGGNVQVR